MRRQVLVLPVLLAACSVFYAQVRSAPGGSGEYLGILGVRVRLGMTKAEVADRLGSRKMKEGSDDTWLFGEGQEWPSTIHFTDGRIDFASQSWIGSDGDVPRALFSAVGSLNKQGYSTCVVSTDTQASPIQTSERTWITCGKKSILISRMQDSKHTYHQVFEELGSLPPDPR
jgi:hypothetical protein